MKVIKSKYVQIWALLCAMGYLLQEFIGWTNLPYWFRLVFYVAFFLMFLKVLFELKDNIKEISTK